MRGGEGGENGGGDGRRRPSRRRGASPRAAPWWGRLVVEATASATGNMPPTTCETRLVCWSPRLSARLCSRPTFSSTLLYFQSLFGSPPVEAACRPRAGEHTRHPSERFRSGARLWPHTAKGESHTQSAAALMAAKRCRQTGPVSVRLSALGPPPPADPISAKGTLSHAPHPRPIPHSLPIPLPPSPLWP